MAVSALARGRWSLGIARQRQINHRSSQSVPPLEVGGWLGRIEAIGWTADRVPTH
jgi:hypothetical protein